MEPYGRIQDHKGPCETKQDNTGPYRTIRHNKTLKGNKYGTIREHMEPYGTIQDHKGPYRSIQDYLGNFLKKPD